MMNDASVVMKFCISNARHLQTLELGQLGDHAERTMGTITKACSRLKHVYFTCRNESMHVACMRHVLVNCHDIVRVKIGALMTVETATFHGKAVHHVSWNNGSAEHMHAVLNALTSPIRKLECSEAVDPDNAFAVLVADRFGAGLLHFSSTMANVDSATMHYFLSHCASLEDLRLVDHAQVLTNEHLSGLPAYCPNLHTLHVYDNDVIDDQGWIELLVGYEQANSLRSLVISNCPNVTDATLFKIADCTHLDYLDILDSNVDPETVKQLTLEGRLCV